MALCLLVFFLCLCFPGITGSGIKNGLSLIGGQVLPALYPFILLTTLFKSVSYTHLDVYKRQYSNRAASRAFCVVSRSSCAMFNLSPYSADAFFSRSYSERYIRISRAFNESRNFKYSLAFSDCRDKGPICFSSSDKISVTRYRFCFSIFRFFSARAFRFLYLTIPTASSKSSRRSSGFPLKILSICP